MNDLWSIDLQARARVAAGKELCTSVVTGLKTFGGWRGKGGEGGRLVVGAVGMGQGVGELGGLGRGLLEFSLRDSKVVGPVRVA